MWLKKAIGLYFWDKTAPNPVPDAFVSITNGRLKSSKDRTDNVTIAILIQLNASIASLDRSNASFFNNYVKGAAIFLYLATNLQ